VIALDVVIAAAMPVERAVMYPLVLPNLHAALAYRALAPESFNCERVP